jgi:putative ABC transport system permease protein
LTLKSKVQLTFTDIALCNLKQRPFRTTSLVLLVTALSFVLFGGSLLAYSLIGGADGLAKRLGADILIVPKGYDQKVEGILLRGEPSAFYMEADWIGKIAAVEGVRAVSPQLFVASLSSDCCSVPIQLIGFDQETDFIIEPWIKTALPRRLSDDEIVIGGSITGKVGDTLKFFGRIYRVAAKMENTGTGFDASVFMNMTAAQNAVNDHTAIGGALPPPDGSISSLTVMVGRDSTVDGVIRDINRAFDYGNSGIVPVAAKTIIHNVSGSLRMLVTFVAALAVLLWLLSVLVLAIVFSVILNERRQEFGILRSLGATRKKLILLVFLESGIVSLSGGLGGVSLAALCLLPFRFYIRETVNLPYMQPSGEHVILIAAVSLLLSFAVGPLAALFSSVKIGRSEPYAVIREGVV